jgi:plastocyanin
MRVPAPVSLAAATAMLLATTLATAPPVAAASPLVIQADQPAAVPAGHLWGFNDFFPRSATVAAGQTIGFAIEGFHTATLLPAGVTPEADLAAHGIAAADEDPSPNLNGTSHVAINFGGVLPTSFACGSSGNPCAFDGSSVVSSGAPLSGPPAGPFWVTVNAAPGTYAFHCRIHPGMAGSLTVVAPGGDTTTPAQAAAATARQVARDTAAGLAAETRASTGAHWTNADGTSTWLVSAGTQSPDRRVAVLEFLPRNLAIKSGDHVMWRPMSSNEPHTVTFPTDLGTDQVPLCEAGAADVGAFPVNFPPAGPQDFGCPPGTGPVEFEFGGGNGVSHVTSPASVSDSGLVGTRRLSNAYGLPPTAVQGSWTVSFAGAATGTYTYVCQVHEGMGATVTVH